MNNIAQCCYINCKKQVSIILLQPVVQAVQYRQYSTGSTVQAVQYRQYSTGSTVQAVQYRQYSAVQYSTGSTLQYRQYSTVQAVQYRQHSTGSTVQAAQHSTGSTAQHRQHSTGSTAQAAQHRQHSTGSTAGSAFLAVQNPHFSMTGNNAQRWKFRIPRGSYLHANFQRYQIQTEGSYLRGYGVI